MKKQITKILGLTLAACMAVQAGVSAFGGTYPQHSTATSAFRGEEVVNHAEWTPSDEGHLFTVGGKTFVLLDTDEEGNYFVLAEDDYGKKEYSTAYENAPIMEEKKEVDGETTYVDSYAKTMDHNIWMYNTTEPTSIGYWLNNSFLENGNGSRALPQEIKDHLLEKDWVVEGLKTLVDWTADQRYGSERSKQLAAEFTLDNGRTVKGKLALMSYTEYKQYADIIGWMYSEANWDGFMLRTPTAWLTSNDGSNVQWKYGSAQVKNTNVKANANPNSKMTVFFNDSGSRANFHVRPVMWLDKDFFKTVAVDLSSVGVLPKEQICKYTDEELAGLYTPEELEKLRGSITSWDWGHYPKHPETFKILTRVETPVAGATPGDSPKENLFTIGGRRFILLDRDVAGNYFVMADEIYGEYLAQYSNPNYPNPDDPNVKPGYLDTLPTDRKQWKQEDWTLDPVKNGVDSLAGRLNHNEWGILYPGDDRPSTRFSYSPNFSGDKTPKHIPIEIQDDLIEFEWETEPAFHDYAWQLQGIEYPWNKDQYTEQVQTEIETWRDTFFKPNAKKVTVKAKIMVPSYTEYETYKDKIGFKDTISDRNWIGSYFRTQMVWLSRVGAKEDSQWKVDPAYLQIKVSGDKLVYTNTGMGSQYMVRPVMWLQKDFFKNNKIDVATAGSTVRAEMRDLYTAEDLADTYSPEEIEQLLHVDALADLTIKSNGEDVTDISTVTDATITAKVTKVGDGESALLIAAVYDANGALLAVNNSTVRFSKTTTVDASVTLNGFSNAASCKVLLWSDVDGMAPLCNAVALPQV